MQKLNIDEAYQASQPCWIELHNMVGDYLECAAAIDGKCPLSKEGYINCTRDNHDPGFMQIDDNTFS